MILAVPNAKKESWVKISPTEYLFYIIKSTSLGLFMTKRESVTWDFIIRLAEEVFLYFYRGH